MDDIESYNKNAFNSYNYTALVPCKVFNNRITFLLLELKIFFMISIFVVKSTVEELLSKKHLIIILRFALLKIHLNHLIERDKVLQVHNKKKEIKILFHVQNAPENLQQIELINMKQFAKELEEAQHHQEQVQKQLQ